MGKDKLGSCGYERMAVKVRDVRQGFKEASLDDSQQSQAKLNRNISDEQLKTY